MVYLILGGMAFCSLISLRVLRDRYFCEGKSNRAYFLFAVINMAIGFYYMYFYDLGCWLSGHCFSDFSDAQTYIALILYFIHFSAAHDALESRS